MFLIFSGIHPKPGPRQNSDYYDISICQANMRSLKHRDSNVGLSTLIHIRCNLAGKFSIITLSETWLSDVDNSHDYTIQGYKKPVCRDCDGVNGAIGYGVILAWVVDNVACNRHNYCELPNREAMWLEVKATNNKFYLCVAY